MQSLRREFCSNWEINDSVLTFPSFHFSWFCYQICWRLLTKTLVLPKQEGLALHKLIVITLEITWRFIYLCVAYWHIIETRNVGGFLKYIYINICFPGCRRPLTSAGFVVQVPFPEHSKSCARLSAGAQVLVFTTRVKRKAAMDLVTESFTKPKRKWDRRKCEFYQHSFYKTLILF